MGPRDDRSKTGLTLTLCVPGPTGYSLQKSRWLLRSHSLVCFRSKPVPQSVPAPCSLPPTQAVPLPPPTLAACFTRLPRCCRPDHVPVPAWWSAASRHLRRGLLDQHRRGRCRRSEADPPRRRRIQQAGAEETQVGPVIMHQRQKLLAGMSDEAVQVAVLIKPRSSSHMMAPPWGTIKTAG